MLSRKYFSLSALAGALACALISPSAYAQTLDCRYEGKTVYEIQLPDTLFAKKATVLTYWRNKNLDVTWIEQSEWDYKVSSGNYSLETLILSDQEPYCSKFKRKCIHNGMKNMRMIEIVLNRFNGTANITQIDTKNYKTQAPFHFSAKCSVAEKQRQRMF